MDKLYIVFAAVGAAAVIVGSFSCVYQLIGSPPRDTIILFKKPLS